MFLAVAAVAGAIVVGLVGIAMTSGTSSSMPQVQVIKDNVTVTGPMAEEVGCSLFGLDCPTVVTSLPGAELVKYQGGYYVHNMTFGTNPGPSTTSTSTQSDGHVVTVVSAGQPRASLVVTVWFTNSTVYCISPSTGPAGNAWPTKAPLCP